MSAFPVNVTLPFSLTKNSYVKRKFTVHGASYCIAYFKTIIHAHKIKVLCVIN